MLATTSKTPSVRINDTDRVSARACSGLSEFFSEVDLRLGALRRREVELACSDLDGPVERRVVDLDDAFVDDGQ